MQMQVPLILPFGDLPEEPQADEWMSEFSTSEPGPAEDASIDWLAEPETETPQETEPTSADWLNNLNHQKSQLNSGTETPQETEPASADWLNDLGSPEKPAEPEADEPIPEFLKDAGWEEDSGESALEPESILDTSDQPAVEGDVPDWMQEMAPPADAVPSETDLGALADVKAEADPEWLQEMESESPESDASWLDELGDKPVDEQLPAIPVREADPAGYLAGDFGEDDTDDWLASLGSGQPAPAAEEDPDVVEKVSGYLAGDYGEDDTDDWLSSLASGETGAKPIEIEIGAADDTVPGSESLTAPEGMDIFGTGESEEESPIPELEPADSPSPSLDESPGHEDEGLAWMESLAVKQGIAEEELVTSPDERVSFDDDHTPDWLSQVEETEAAEAVEDAGLSDIFDTPPPAADIEQAAEPEPIPEGEDDHALDWLTNISEEAVEEVVVEEESVPSTSQLESLPGLDGVENPADNLQATL